MVSVSDLRKGCAVVTGAGSGVGGALASHAAHALGMSVAALDVSFPRAEEKASQIREGGGNAIPYAVDVSDYSAVDRIASHVYDALGPVTLLAANAGIEHSGRLWATPSEQWRRVQDVNVNGMFNTIKGFVPQMIDSGLRGHVVCVASIGGLGFRASMGAYIVSKHAALALGESLALDLESADAKVGVSILLPGPVATRIADDALISPSHEAEAARAQLAALLDAEGVKPSEIARATFSGIAEGRKWIYTHPEMAAEAVAEMVTRLQASVDTES